MSLITDHRGEIWGNLGPPVEVGDSGVLLLMTIEDLQSRLNINNLIEGKQRKRLPQDPNNNSEENANEGEDAVPQ